jgi:hypothetical protein
MANYFNNLLFFPAFDVQISIDREYAKQRKSSIIL